MTTTLARSTNAADHPAAARKLLSFCLGTEEFGLDILSVREIIGLIDITPMPRTPAHVKGVINLRGKIIPVIDLRTRFGLGSVAHTDQTCIIVVDVPNTPDADRGQMGLIVDSVREVLDIPTGSIDPPPRFGGRAPMEFVTAIGKVKERVVLILDAECILTPSSGVESSTTAVPPATHTESTNDAANKAA